MYFVFFMLAIYTITVQSDDEFPESLCTTPKGVMGDCISIYDCDHLQHIVKNKSRTAQEIEYLRNSTCGFHGKIPKICCPIITELPAVVPPPISCVATDGRIGKCLDSDSNRISTRTIITPTIASSSCQATISAYPPDPKSKCCGIDSALGDRIFGGDITAIDQYPWLVLLEYSVGEIIRTTCGGALISGKYVLTAAHCVFDSNGYGTPPQKVRLGEYDTSNEGPDCVLVEDELDCTTGAIRIDIERIIPHPQFDPFDRRKQNDIALIRLKEMAPFTDFIRPICLPSTDITIAPSDKLVLTVAGFGATSSQNSSSSLKLYVNLPFVNQTACQSTYRAPGRRLQLWKNQLCAGGDNGKDSCKGDSGGPLMYEKGRTYEITGVVSFGYMTCGTKDIPGIYTKVFEYIDWIRRNLQP